MCVSPPHAIFFKAFFLEGGRGGGREGIYFIFINLILFFLLRSPFGSGGDSSSDEGEKMLSARLLTPAEKNPGDTIRIGREIRCLSYAGFL